MRNHAVQRAGFTLVELLAVMMIIGILAGLILGVSSYASRKASESKAIAEIERIKNACENIKIDLGKYPGTIGARIEDTDLQKITENDTNLIFTNDITDPFDNMTVGSWICDPWGNAYCISNLGFSIRVISAGQNPEDAADDIDSSKGQ